jgi:hypothetical protein
MNALPAIPPLMNADDFEREVMRELAACGLRSEPAVKNFALERWSQIDFDLNTEWRIKGVLPKQGVGLIYGKSQSFKSFIAMHMALCVTLGRSWAGKRVEKTAAVYIAAEGAAGLRKRKAGYVKTWRNLPAEVDFHLVPAAPNLGTEKGDLEALIASIEAFPALQLPCPMHSPRRPQRGSPEQTPRMVRARCRARRHDPFRATRRRYGGDAHVQKLKDDASDISLTAHLSRIVLGHDCDGDEVSTLVVDDVFKADLVAKRNTPRPVSKSERLLMDAIANAVDEAGEEIQPYVADPLRVRAVDEQNIRERYFDRVAEKAGEDEDKKKVYDRNRKNFKNALKRVIAARVVVAATHDRKRYIWLP